MKTKTLSLEERIASKAASIQSQLAMAKGKPEFEQEVYLRTACPANVSKERYGVAIRRAHDMLHAHPSSINSEYVDVPKRTPVLPASQTIIIIPNDDKLRTLVGSSPMKWTVHQLRYSKGCLAIKDDGTETETFPNVARLLSTIKQYGFTISKVTK